MDILMPPAFPNAEFRAFEQAATKFFPPLLSDEALFDPQEKRRHFEWAWQAVRYRYRSCTECQDEFRALLAAASEEWRAGWPDEELSYKLERCIYVFFTSALSVFDSFAFCLYFLGHALQPGAFLDAATPRKITRSATAKAYTAAFPQATIARLLAELADDAGFAAIDAVRNVVGHRLAGRRSVASSGTVHDDGTLTEDWRTDSWALPGAATGLDFSEDMLQRHLDEMTGLLAPLASAAREFAQNHQPVQSTP
jgi:hypothetical protein